jgi:adrenodoxin-NADP+ reductase
LPSSPPTLPIKHGTLTNTFQAAFTNKELRELINLSHDLPVRFNPIDPCYLPSEVDIKAGGRASKRRFEILSKRAQAPPTSSNSADLKSWSFAFRRAPTAFLPSPTNTLASIRFKVTNSPPDIQEIEDMPASLAFRSIGYSSEPLPGMLNIGVPFKHSTGTIPNDGLGRVLDSAMPEGDEGEGSRHVPGMYCAGWVKRGPTGVIASTMTDAFQTAEIIAEDWIAGAPFIGVGDGEGLEGKRVETVGKRVKAGWGAIKAEAEKRGIRAIGWEDWKKIGEEEARRGKEVGKVREKFGSVEEMLKVLD